MISDSKPLRKLLVTLLLVLLSICACTFHRFQPDGKSVPPDSLVCLQQNELTIAFVNVWCGEGPDHSVIIENLGDFYLYSPPDWTVEQLELELPVHSSDLHNPSLDMVYCNEISCLIALVGNGIFRIPWGDHEADSILVLGLHYNNKCFWNNLIPLQDGKKLLASIDRNLYLIDIETMTVLDTLHFEYCISTSILDNEGTLAYLLHSNKDSISIIDISAPGSLVIQRTLYPEVELDTIGFISSVLVGQRRGSLFIIETTTGACTNIWSPSDNSFWRYEWILSYPWGPYVHRVDRESDLLELIDLTDLSVLQSISLNMFFDPLICFVTPQEGILYHPLTGVIYKLIRSRCRS